MSSSIILPLTILELEQFSRWVLSVGDGIVTESTPTDNPDICWIQIPDYLMLPMEQRNLAGLISFVYGSMPHSSKAADYLCNRAILAPTNEVAASINTEIIKQIATEEMSYYSCDTIDDTVANYCTVESLYPTEFLNTISMSGILIITFNLKLVCL